MERKKKAQAERSAVVEITDGECPALACANEGKACHKVLGALDEAVGTGGGVDFCEDEADETPCGTFKSLVDVGCIL